MKRSIWPLPGGVGKYAETLLSCLDFIAKEKPDWNGLRQWFFDTFPQMKARRSPQRRGQIAVDGYIQVIESDLGLISSEGGRMALTGEGTRYLESKDPKFLYQILNGRVAGIEDILLVLREGNQDLKEIHKRLVSRLGVSWESSNQTLFRVGWLQSIGVIAKSGRKYILTDIGSEVIEGLQPPPKFKVGNEVIHKMHGRAKVVSMEFKEGKWRYTLEKVKD